MQPNPPCHHLECSHHNPHSSATLVQAHFSAWGRKKSSHSAQCPICNVTLSCGHCLDSFTNVSSREFVRWEGGVRTCAQDRSKQKRTAAKAISSIVDALEYGAGELAPVAVCCGCRQSVVSGSVGGVNIFPFFSAAADGSVG